MQGVQTKGTATQKRFADEALRRAKIAGKQPGCYYGGITLRSGKKGFAVYREGKVVEQYFVLNKNAHRNGER